MISPVARISEPTIHTVKGGRLTDARPACEHVSLNPIANRITHLLFVTDQPSALFERLVLSGFLTDNTRLKAGHNHEIVTGVETSDDLSVLTASEDLSNRSTHRLFSSRLGTHDRAGPLDNAIGIDADRSRSDSARFERVGHDMKHRCGELIVHNVYRQRCRLVESDQSIPERVGIERFTNNLFLRQARRAHRCHKIIVVTPLTVLTGHVTANAHGIKDEIIRLNRCINTDLSIE